MPAPDPTDLLCHSIQQAQERHQLFPATADATPLPVIVGVSGGADSLCLLHLLARFAQPWNLALHVAHLDHSVRSNSAEDAAFVRELAVAWGLPFHTRRLSQAEIDSADNNLEAALRRLRYGFFADVVAGLTAAGEVAPTVAVAHTADDQAETILMHLLRGSGLAGLVGMRPVSFPTVGAGGDRAIRLVRPLLDVPHTNILQYLNAHDLTWREDPSNRDMAFTRNRLRHQILPQLAELYSNPIEALTRLGALLAAENERAEELNKRAFHTLLQEDTGAGSDAVERAVLDRSAFRALDLATQRGVLRCAAAHLGLPSEEMNYERTEALRIAIIAGETAGPTPLAGDIAWSAEAHRFSLHRSSALAFAPQAPFLDAQWRACFGAQSVPLGGAMRVGAWNLTCREVEQTDLPADWQASSDPWQAVCDARWMDDLLLATPRRGQQFAPLGMEGRHKHLGDFFTDNKISVALRAGWPLLLDGASGEILWVCGLRLAHSARIRPDTKRIFHLKWSKG